MCGSGRTLRGLSAHSFLLYGFATVVEKHAFDLLMGVQHVGSKLALAVLSVLSPRDLVAAITHEDVERIDAVPGVGAKVAERIVRELCDKVGGLNLMPEQVIAISSNGHAIEVSLVDDAVLALINLGYKPAEAKRACSNPPDCGKSRACRLVRQTGRG